MENKKKSPLFLEEALKDGRVLSFLNVLKTSDDETYGHSKDVASLTAMCLEEMIEAGECDYTEEECIEIIKGALLHDIGKMLIPNEILTKPGKLTDEEFQTIKEHPMLGYNILKTQDINYHVCMAALMHHERCDGHGYPSNLTGDKIDSFAKIVAIADVYDALTASRCYRGPVCPLEVIGIFQTEGLTQYDPKYLMVFLDRVMCSYLHYTVKLSNGETGKIVLMHRNSLARPVISLENGSFIDLTSERNITIVGVV